MLRTFADVNSGKMENHTNVDLKYLFTFFCSINFYTIIELIFYVVFFSKCSGLYVGKKFLHLHIIYIYLYSKKYIRATVFHYLS